MQTTNFLLASALLMMTCTTARGQDYSVEVINAAPDAGEVSESLTKEFADKGIRVKQGADRTICEVWLCKQWTMEAEFTATDRHLYPFSPGQLIGLLHYSRRGKEFRDQTVKSGWYTLRFGLQPVDGNHVGTSPTNDFLLLIDAEQDEPDKEWDRKELYRMSAGVAGSTHPAMLCLQPPTKGSEPTIRKHESNDWWILHAAGRGVADKKTIDVPLDLIVVGHAAE